VAPVYITMGGSLLAVLVVGLIWRKFRTLDLRLQDLRKELEELHILKTRLFLKELNASGSGMRVTHLENSRN